MFLEVIMFLVLFSIALELMRSLFYLSRPKNLCILFTHMRRYVTGIVSSECHNDVCRDFS